MSEPRPDITVDLLNERGNEYLPGYLGIEIIELAPQTLRCRMAIKKLHIAPNQFLHAASVVALADTACGYAAFAHLPDGA
ncbi:MAG: PaaI family thioesterase, partial [Candidatus Competibacteraceae bacterium]|nr:PaaI family thioesterase [Candidatus Competibacteraceae bacterium]